MGAGVPRQQGMGVDLQRHRGIQGCHQASFCILRPLNTFANLPQRVRFCKLRCSETQIPVVFWLWPLLVMRPLLRFISAQFL